jgi:aryl-alcohol dehydrogenase-like predicted oxidoreductase
MNPLQRFSSLNIDPMYAPAMIPLRTFGATGHLSSRVIFGAAALGAMSPSRADATVQLAFERGINHIDTAASYGRSEELLAPFLAEHRHEVFLATKTGERTAAGARRELERSLTRLGVDHVDLIQLHNLVEPDELDAVHQPGGALEALVAALEEGLVRHIGVTGHGLRIARAHLTSLERFDFASVLFPYNPVLAGIEEYARDVAALLEVCAERSVAVQTIKAVARRRWQADDPSPKYAWYEPLPVGPALQRAVSFVLANDQMFVNTSSDARLLPAILDAAEHLVAVDDDSLASDTEDLNITPLFDGADLERI